MSDEQAPGFGHLCGRCLAERLTALSVIRLAILDCLPGRKLSLDDIALADAAGSAGNALCYISRPGRDALAGDEIIESLSAAFDSSETSAASEERHKARLCGRTPPSSAGCRFVPTVKSAALKQRPELRICRIARGLRGRASRATLKSY